ncbi:DUF3040 domain-containing protein [Streptomyces sp. NPDC004284]|uniref:DUF3040 domain-containing protein n=1 Tax=Streptomyces sp. NPDC004284 TaxID=3364695 RepID=UPI0036ACD6CA
MDGPELSQRERQILDDIEQDLRADQLLDRRLRTLHRGIRPWTSRRGDRHRLRGLGLRTVLLGIACAVLFVRAVATSSLVLIWAFATVWVLTLVRLLLLAIRWCRKAAVRRAAGRADHVA